MNLTQLKGMAFNSAKDKKFFDMGYRVLRKMKEENFDKEEIEYIELMIRVSGLAQIVTEVGEAIQQLRLGDSEDNEVADIVISTLSYSGRWGIPIQQEVIGKMEYNDKRSPVHGRRF